MFEMTTHISKRGNPKVEKPMQKAKIDKRKYGFIIVTEIIQNESLYVCCGFKNNLLNGEEIKKGKFRNGAGEI